MMSANNFTKSQIVVPCLSVFPEGALEVDGYDVAGSLLAHPLGGGPQFIIPPARAAQLRPVSPVECQTPLFRKARFRIEGVNGEFEGWTDGAAWNGWAMPHFEFGVALQVGQAVGAHFDDWRDCFVAKSQETEDIWKAREIVVLGGAKVEVYPIGARAWIWEEA